VWLLCCILEANVGKDAGANFGEDVGANFGEAVGVTPSRTYGLLALKLGGGVFDLLKGSARPYAGCLGAEPNGACKLPATG
jgi:hypothetical protein